MAGTGEAPPTERVLKDAGELGIAVGDVVLVAVDGAYHVAKRTQGPAWARGGREGQAKSRSGKQGCFA